MARHTPTASEEMFIERLTAAGYKVVRTRTYSALLERIRLAECRADMEAERRESAERWAHNSLAEERRLSRRLDEVCTGAAALGVPIDKINAALAAADKKEA